MLQIDPASPVAINDQIKAGLKGLVARGLLQPGDEAPSVRALAASLKVNPNTVARALRELALEGFLDTRRGEGSVVAEDAVKRAKDGLRDARGLLLEALRLARRGGLPWDEVDALIKECRKGER